MGRDIAPRELANEITIHTSSLFDSKQKCFVSDISLVVDASTGLITKTYKRDGGGRQGDLSSSSLSSSSTTTTTTNLPETKGGGAVIDLRGLTVLPGLVDAHTHVFLHPYAETASLHQMRDESVVERVLRAANHARAALAAGYTTYRDLGTEGLGDADAHLRDAVNRGLVPGPRLFVATECIASSAGYELRRENGRPGTGLAVPRISDPADGVDGVRAAVRRRREYFSFLVLSPFHPSFSPSMTTDHRSRPSLGEHVLLSPLPNYPRFDLFVKYRGGYKRSTRWLNFFLYLSLVGAGADIVKFYADYRKRSLRFPAQTWPGAAPIRFPPASDPFNNERNPNVLLFTQEEMDALVAEARASGAPVAAHAQSPAAVVMAARAGVTTVEHGYIPDGEAVRAMREHGTIFVPTLAVFEASYDAATLRAILDHARAAFDAGVRIAAGGDTGAIAHGENVRELELLARAGLPVPDVLQAATLRGWEACGAELCGRRFGALEPGFAADIIAVDGDFERDLGALRKVKFVMKDGAVYKDELA